jgi:hypothetical protein
MELTPIYKDGKVLQCAQDQLPTVLADGWSTEEPKPAPKVEPKKVEQKVAQKPVKTESVNKDSGDDVFS